MSVRLMSAVAARLNLKMFSFDFENAFLNATLKEPEFLRPPTEFAVLAGDEDLRNGKCLLMVNKAIYGMIQCSLELEWSNTLAKVVGDFACEGCELKRLLTDRCAWAWMAQR